MKKKLIIFISLLLVVLLGVIVLNLTKTTIPKETLAIINNYKRYYEEYGDYYALILIKKLYEDENITKDSYYNEVNEILNETYPEATTQYSYYSALLNGRMEEIDEVSFGYFLDALVSNAYTGQLRLSLFDHPKQRERVEAGVKIIDKWIENPNDGNTKAFEQLMSSKELTDEEKVYLMRWNEGRTSFKDISKGGKIYSYEEYTEKVIIDEEKQFTYLNIFFNSQDALFVRNNAIDSQ